MLSSSVLHCTNIPILSTVQNPNHWWRVFLLCELRAGLKCDWPWVWRSCWPRHRHWQTCAAPVAWPTSCCRTSGIHPCPRCTWTLSSAKPPICLQSLGDTLTASHQSPCKYLSLSTWILSSAQQPNCLQSQGDTLKALYQSPCKYLNTTIYTTTQLAFSHRETHLLLHTKVLVNHCPWSTWMNTICTPSHQSVSHRETHLLFHAKESYWPSTPFNTMYTCSP